MSHADEHDESRRDFIYYATAGAGAVVTGAAVWPLINQMNPSADVLAQAQEPFDISLLDPGQQVTILWQGQPVFLRRRTAEEIEEARAVDISELPDPVAGNANLADDAPATDENRSAPLPEGSDMMEGELLVQSGVCTHLGCVPIGDGAGDFGGWFCPCHGSHYDSSGRIRRGPAPSNLPIPPLSYRDATTILIG